jgi:cell division protein FtsW
MADRQQQGGRRQFGRRYWSKPDRAFTLALLVLTGFGLLMVFSASMYTSSVSSATGSGYTQFVKQAVYVIGGLFVLWFASRIDYRKFNNVHVAVVALIITAALLGLVLVAGSEVNGAKRWLAVGSITFQPSEFAKLTGIIYASSIVCQKKEVYSNFWKFTLYCILPMVVLCGLAAIEPSLSAAMAIGFGMLCVYFFSGIKFRYFIPYILLIVAAVGLALILQPFRLDRIRVFMGKGGADYQIRQSILAIGSGGIFGKGLGNGRQKMLFLPELQNDFIFANIGEECGLVGCVLLLILYGFIIYRGIRIAKASKTKFGYVYGCSIMALLGFQVIVNVAVATNIMPVTGMALPFISAGGTSMIILFFMMSLIVNMSRKPGRKVTAGAPKTKRRKRQKTEEKTA